MINDAYFFQQIENLTHVPVCSYNRKEKTRTDYSPDVKLKKLTEEQDEKFRSAAALEEKDYPVIREIENELVLVEIRDGVQPDNWLIAGPVILEPVENKYRARVMKKYKNFGEIGFEISACRIETLVSEALLLFWAATGRKITAAEFWEFNREQSEKIRDIMPRMSMDIFLRQENYVLHNPYEQEQRELESIRNGDLAALKASISETYEGKIGTLAKNPLRHHKNVAIGNITLASRAAVQGGVSAEQSFSMADSLIQQLEDLDNVPEVESFKREAQYAYALAVEQEQGKKMSGGGCKKPSGGSGERLHFCPSSQFYTDY